MLLGNPFRVTHQIDDEARAVLHRSAFGTLDADHSDDTTLAPDGNPGDTGFLVITVLKVDYQFDVSISR